MMDLKFTCTFFRGRTGDHERRDSLWFKAVLPTLMMAALATSSMAAPSKKATTARPVAKKTAARPAGKKAVARPAARPAKKAAAKPAKAPATAPARRLPPYTESISGTLVKFDMLPVPAGTVSVAPTTDAPKGAKPKTVAVKPFWIGKTEATWDMFDVWYLFLDTPGGGAPVATGKDSDAISRPTRPYGAPDRGFGHTGYAAISVTFLAADEYCKWLSQKTGKKYRLPTEAEWEHAARAGTKGNGPTGAELQKVAWVWENADNKAHPVGTKPANAWGIHDMLGNVGEWCIDLNGKPALCGGSFNDDAAKVSFATRAYQTDDWNATDPQIPKGRWWLPDAPFAGFRVVREE